jgi:galactonate dehydratase
VRVVDVRPLVLGTAWRNLTFVVVRTDEGLEGVGEVRMINETEALLGYLAEAVPVHVLGADPFAIEALIQRMWRREYARAGAIAMSALAVLEIACWDIVGKALEQPVYRLLGGPVRDRVKAYANGWYTVERTPDEFRAAARRVVDAGYHALKLDPFGAGAWELEPAERVRAVELVEAVREEVGPEVEILVEMHGRFTPAQAVSIARDLEPYGPSWIEEPVPPENLAALKKVADRVTIPVATGERIHARDEFRELFELQAADVVQPDLTMCGGIAETRRIAAWAEAYYMLVAPHNVGGPVSTAAALHLAAATPNFKIQEHFNDFCESYVKQAAPGNPEVVDGYFALPQGPGLGVVLDEDVVAENPRREIHFDLFREDWHLRQAGQRPDAAAAPPAAPLT